MLFLFNARLFAHEGEKIFVCLAALTKKNSGRTEMKRSIFIALLFIIALFAIRELPRSLSLPNASGVAEAQSLNEPELPRVLLNTTFPSVSGVTINVAAGGNLQSALNTR